MYVAVGHMHPDQVSLEKLFGKFVLKNKIFLVKTSVTCRPASDLLLWEQQ